VAMREDEVIGGPRGAAVRFAEARGA